MAKTPKLDFRRWLMALTALHEEEGLCFSAPDKKKFPDSWCAFHNAWKKGLTPKKMMDVMYGCCGPFREGGS